MKRAVLAFLFLPFAAANANEALKFWTDVSPANCAEHLRAKVVSVTAKKADVLVRVKLDKGGKTHTSTVNGAKVGDFKVGSAFCAQDKAD